MYSTTATLQKVDFCVTAFTNASYQTQNGMGIKYPNIALYCKFCTWQLFVVIFNKNKGGEKGSATLRRCPSVFDR